MLFLLPQQLFQLKHCLEKLSNDSNTANFKTFWFLSQYHHKVSFSQSPITSLGVPVLDSALPYNIYAFWGTVVEEKRLRYNPCQPDPLPTHHTHTAAGENTKIVE